MAKVRLFYDNRKICVDSPDVCPHCLKGILPIDIARTQSEHVFESSGEAFNKCVIVYECPICHKIFFGIYNWYFNSTNKVETDAIVGGSPAVTVFNAVIKKISPKFVEIYNQSEQSEFYGCKEICGIGFRKSLEVLLKDFAIYKSPSDKAIIISPDFPLAQCIDKYIDDDDVKDLCKKSSWIGNDFAHYMSKHDGFGLENLKELINLCVGDIEHYIKKIEYRKSIEKK